MEAIESALEELGIAEEPRNEGRAGHRRNKRDPEEEFHSKNLETERRRRAKLGGKLLTLRSIVPNITNMTKAAIVEDAIAYIEELQKIVSDLSDRLDEKGEESSCEDDPNPKVEPIDAAEGTAKCGLEEDVKVAYVGENKLWVKMILRKKKGRLTKLIEAMKALGFELIDVCVTTHEGAVLITSFVEGTLGGKVADQNARELLLETVRGV